MVQVSGETRELEGHFEMRGRSSAMCEDLAVLKVGWRLVGGGNRNA